MQHQGSARIVGCAALTGAGRGAAAFWQALSAATPLQARHDLGDPRLNDAKYVRIESPRDPAPELAAAWLQDVCDEALRAAAPTLRTMRAPRLALLCGTSLGGMSAFEAAHRTRWGEPSAGPGLAVNRPPPSAATYDGPATAVGARLPLTTGAWTLNTACSSAANALGLSRLWLAKGRIDAAVVAGVDVISPFVYAGFSCINAVDPEPTAPFGRDRRGLNLGEAAVAFVLTRSADAVHVPQPVDLVGFGCACDAHHLTRPDPTGLGLGRAIAAALTDAGLGPGAIGLLSAHATGTPHNDRMEAAAFAHVFGAALPPLHAAKPVAGHTLGASGAVDALAVMLMLQHEEVPPTFARGAPDPTLACQPTRERRRLSPTTIALSTSSGFGGSNTALVFKRGDA
ncbi:MAG: hypothetical protein HY903_10980 [Deltaproteobacteria bacterium]|nr:hypothetical protein [Deltaproteobacteria bacterium]